MKTAMKWIPLALLLLGSSAVPADMAAEDVVFKVTVPARASVSIGKKSAHFVDFQQFEPTATETSGEVRTVSFTLPKTQLNYRIMMDGALTQTGIFTPQDGGVLEITEADMKAMSPKQVNHDPHANSGYETGDIYVNINPQNYLRLNVGDTFDAHAMRTWQLTSDVINNYFMEPDFHYTVLTLDGKPSTGVLEIESLPGSAWADIKAVGKGTAIVLVTYDAIRYSKYDCATKLQSDVNGGQYWGAIWPENTAAYVVTVGETESAVVPNMTVNEKYNADTKKLAGANVDAEHDVFYYLESEPGYRFTFKPENAVSVTMAYPVIGANSVSYTGFGSDGVTLNADGSYTLLLKEGRQIVRLTDAAGNSTYQVLRARSCTREITNATRPGSRIFLPGDKVNVHYDGLYHPANKLAGIYNMSAYVCYNGNPNGDSLYGSGNQYQFASSGNQNVSFTIPADTDPAATPQITLTEGVINVKGFGDPIGNHRSIDRQKGRQPNYNAVSHDTYFGAIPDITIPVSAAKQFAIKVVCDPADAELDVIYKDAALSKGSDGLYSGSYGDYTITASAKGYNNFEETFSISDDAEGLQTFNVTMVKTPANGWDGTTLTEPKTGEQGQYLVGTGYELAWLAKYVNDGNGAVNAELTADIDLGGHLWSPIGLSSSFKGNFDGKLHKITGLKVDGSASNAGLFGIVEGASSDNQSHISGVIVYGKVSNSSTNTGGIAGSCAFAKIEKCANYATVTSKNIYAGGIVGRITKTSEIIDCYNRGQISGSRYTGGIIGSGIRGTAVTNVYSTVKISGTLANALIGNVSSSTITNGYGIGTQSQYTAMVQITDEMLSSGELAYRLSGSFGQTLGTEDHPTLTGEKVYKVTYTSNLDAASKELYSNPALPNMELPEGILFAEWRTAADGSAVTAISADSNLYLYYAKKVTAISIDPASAQQTQKTSLQLSATVAPADAHNQTVTWTSSDPSIASVDAQGIVTFLLPGECDITATAADGSGISASCHLTVDPILASAIALNITEYSGAPESTVQLTATVTPDDTYNPSVAWMSSNSSIASVDAMGLVTVHRSGSATITASTTDGTGLSATCEITGIDSVDAVWADGRSRDVYTATGILVIREASRADLIRLPAGIYITSLSEKFIVK